jgi:hypothetical protein
MNTPTNQSEQQPQKTPKFGTIDVWMALTGISRRMTYEYLGRGDLKAVKVGTRTLINIEKGLAWLEAQPAAQIRPQKPRKSAA